MWQSLLLVMLTLITWSRCYFDSPLDTCELSLRRPLRVYFALHSTFLLWFFIYWRFLPEPFSGCGDCKFWVVAYRVRWCLYEVFYSSCDRPHESSSPPAVGNYLRLFPLHKIGQTLPASVLQFPFSMLQASHPLSVQSLSRRDEVWFISFWLAIYKHISDCLPVITSTSNALEF